MEHRVKVTVLDKKLFPELQAKGKKMGYRLKL